MKNRTYRIADLAKRPAARRFLARLNDHFGTPESWGSSCTMWGEQYGFSWHGTPRGAVYIGANYTIAKSGTKSVLLVVNRPAKTPAALLS